MEINKERLRGVRCYPQPFESKITTCIGYEQDFL